MNKIESALINTAVTYVTNYVKYEKKNYVIEPISCMIRLAILAFKSKGTKISIYDNTICIQEPSLLQGPIRWISGNNRNDIHYLLSPINKALTRYDIHTNDSLLNIYKLSVKGLTNLKISYNKHNSSSLTSHCIELYINKINDCITNKDKNKKIEEEDDRTYLYFKKLWSDEQLEIINNLFKECSKNPNDKDAYLFAIENILDSKLKPIKEILVKHIHNCI